MKKVFCVLASLSGLLLSMTACQTGDSQRVYQQPEIEGRVVDANTGEPVADVVIVRDPRSEEQGNPDYLSSGVPLVEQDSIYTGDDGGFSVGSQRTDVEGDIVWTSLTLKFLHPNYQMYSTNFSFEVVGDGEPRVYAGDIRLQPLPAEAPEGSE